MSTITTARKYGADSGVWPDLFNTLRKSCEIDWAGRLLRFVLRKWIGHNIDVSGKHYANLVTDSYFDAVAGSGAGGEAGEVRQAERAEAESGESGKNAEPTICGIPEDSSQFQTVEVGAEGFEPPTKGL